MIRAYEERHNLKIVHAWGMTEMTPLGTICNLPASMAGATDEEQLRYRAKQGTPMPLVEIRATSDKGEVPWDGANDGRARSARTVGRVAVLQRSGPDPTIHRATAGSRPATS